MNPAHYFDVNASTPVDPLVMDEALRWMRAGFANPSSAHAEGRSAAAAIQDARRKIAEGLNATAEEIYFTSGGTESNNWALFGTAGRAREGHLVVSAIEHKSVLSSARELEARGFTLDLVKPRADGSLRVEDVAAKLRADTRLVSVMFANNETGVLQPVDAIGKLCRSRGVRFHVDAVCALGKVPLDVERIGCDLLSLSSHKLYAPKGCGVLYVRRGLALDPFVRGCGQQDGMRGGTENTPGAVAFGKAFERLAQGALGDMAQVAELRDLLLARLIESFPGLERNGTGAALPNTLNVAFPGASAGELLEALGRRGFSVSAGSAAGACGTISHVLEAMDVEPARARASLRLSLGAHSTRAGVEDLVACLCELLPMSRSSLSR